MHTHTNSKQQVRYISRMNLDMQLIFCMCLGIHKYIYLILSIHMGVVRQCQSFGR